MLHLAKKRYTQYYTSKIKMGIFLIRKSYLKSAAMQGLLNEILCIHAPQRTVKLSKIKVLGPKTLLARLPTASIFISSIA